MYSKAIVTFIDILGFSSLVEKSGPDIINKVLETVEKSISPIVPDDAEMVAFSDSVVRVRRIKSKYPIESIFQEFLSLVHAQGELIDFDIVIRGGVSIGDIFFSDGRVFGPGLLKSYELESKFALYPRIIIDPQLMKDYLTIKHPKKIWVHIKHDVEIICDLLRQSDDGMWYIDYATALEQELNELEMYPNFLTRHKEVILSGAKKHAHLNSILGKYIWMAHYHNKLIDSLNREAFEQYDLEKNDFLITSDDIPSLQYLIS